MQPYATSAAQRAVDGLEEHDSYQQSFDQLMRDLCVETPASTSAFLARTSEARRQRAVFQRRTEERN